MKIKTNIRYGLRTMIEIAKSEKPVLQKEIAARQEISVNYLDSIISRLKNAGLIINYGGKSSGYILTKDTKDITVYDIYRAFNPPVQLVNCACETYKCQRIESCPSKDFWLELNTEIKAKLNSKTLAQFLNSN